MHVVYAYFQYIVHVSECFAGQVGLMARGMLNFYLHYSGTQRIVIVPICVVVFNEERI